MLFIYINAGATVGDNICASSTLAVTSDSHYDHHHCRWCSRHTLCGLMKDSLQQRLRNGADAEQIAEEDPRHLNQLINVHFIIDGVLNQVCLIACEDMKCFSSAAVERLQTCPAAPVLLLRRLMSASTTHQLFHDTVAFNIFALRVKKVTL